MCIVSACDKCKSKLRTPQGNKQIRAGAQNAQQLRRDCAMASTSTLPINRPDSQTFTLETRCFPQVKVPSTAAYDEARNSTKCRHSPEEVSRAIQMLTPSELRGHRNAKLNSRISLPCPDVITQLDSSCPLDV